MKKLVVMLTCVMMLLMSSVSVFAANSPKANDATTTEASPKTGESAAMPMALALTAAGLTVCFAKSKKVA